MRSTSGPSTLQRRSLPQAALTTRRRNRRWAPQSWGTRYWRRRLTVAAARTEQDAVEPWLGKKPTSKLPVVTVTVRCSKLVVVPTNMLSSKRLANITCLSKPIAPRRPHSMVCAGWRKRGAARPADYLLTCHSICRQMQHVRGKWRVLQFRSSARVL